MNQLTRITAVEYAPHHVRVNAVLPGLMKTPMVAAAVGFIDAYGKGDVDAMWRARSAGPDGTYG
jgi:NAD(P)-dependent dehydrogenase (short-subunit alcohol dehydrogenase family)